MMEERRLGKRIDGRAIASTIREEIKHRVIKLAEESGGAVVPGLGVVLVGARKDSQTYVRMKKNAAEEVGISFTLKEFPGDVSQDALIEQVRAMNADAAIHGIIVQLPLPSHVNERAVCDEVAHSKDVDGFHPLNLGALALKGRDPTFIPGTPKGIMEILKREDIKVEGKRAVVLGRSNIVGMPIALLLNNANATVTICHSRTPDVASICREADIVIAAIGIPNYVKKDWVKPGAVVIDVGINSVDDATRKRGYRLVGDVDYQSVREVAGAITPVPGGVGPLTVAMLLQQTLEAAERASGE